MDLDDWAALDEQACATHHALKYLVESFDSENGLPQKAYDATCNLLIAQLGDQAWVDFANAIDATDGQFYFKNSADCQSTVQKIFGE